MRLLAPRPTLASTKRIATESTLTNRADARTVTAPHFSAYSVGAAFAHDFSSMPTHSQDANSSSASESSGESDELNCPDCTSAKSPAKPVVPTFSLEKPPAVRTPFATNSITSIAQAPTITGSVTCDQKAALWGYKLDSFDSGGVIRIYYMPESQYPAPNPPDDSGPLTNVTKQNYVEILSDLRANKYGVPQKWYSYQRENLHEDYHWYVQWKGVIAAMLPKLESDIATLSISCLRFPSAATALAVIEPAVQRALALRYEAALHEFRLIPDAPGKGSPAYDAAAVGVQKLIDAVESHVKSKGWKVPPSNVESDLGKPSGK